MLTPFRTVILFFMLSLLGAAFIPRLPVAFTPDYALPGLEVNYTLPNASPEIVEQQATAPLENALSQISGIRKITSKSGYKQGGISLTFQSGTDLDLKRFEVGALIRQLYPKLPQGLSYPLIEPLRQQDAEKSPLLTYNITAAQAPYQIQEVSNKVLRQPLLQLEGIEDVQLNGAIPQQISIRYQTEMLHRFGITPEEIAEQITKRFAELPLGFYRNGKQTFHLKASNPLRDIGQLEEMLVITRQGKHVRLKQVSTISLEEEVARSHFRINGSNTITLSIQARKGTNRLALAEEVKTVLAAAEKQLPTTYRLLLNYDDTGFLQQELYKIYWRVSLSVLILLSFIFLLKRNLRYMMVLFIGITVNLCITVLLMYWIGNSIHLYTLAGLTISLGLIMDNAIVMLDHLERKGNRRVFLALLGASLTTISALCMILFLPEQEQQNLLEFGQVVSLNLGVSLLVALFFTPALQHLLLLQKEQKKKTSLKKLRQRIIFFHVYHSSICFLANYRKGLIICLILLFGLPVFMLPVEWKGRDWYNTTIGSDRYQDDVRPYVDKILGGTLRLFMRDVLKNSGYRTPEEPKLYITAELPYGNTLAQMDTIIRKLEAYLIKVEGIDRFISRVISGNYAHLTITFQTGYHEGTLPYQLKSRLTARGLDWGGVDWNIWGVGKGFSNSTGENIANFRVLLKGYNFEELEQQAQVLAQKLQTHKRIEKVSVNEQLSWRERSSREWLLELEQGALSLREFSLPQAIQTLRRQGKATTPSLYVSLQDKQIPIQLERQAASNFDKYRLMSQPIHLNDNLRMEFSEFAWLILQRTANTIYKEDRQYLRIVGFDYLGNTRFGNKYLDEKLEEMRAELPVGYTAEKTGWGWDSETVQRQYGLLAVLIVVIFFICSILFENFQQPFFIIAIIPVSFIGLFLIFAVFDFYFDQGGYAAFILLGGIVVNAAIFIINDLNNLSGKNRNRAVIKAVAQKAQPILLTILSTCLGLVPFLLGGDSEVFWFSLAAGTIGGLIFSVFAIFFLLPLWLWKKDKGRFQI